MNAPRVSGRATGGEDRGGEDRKDCARGGSAFGGSTRRIGDRRGRPRPASDAARQPARATSECAAIAPRRAADQRSRRIQPRGIAWLEGSWTTTFFAISPGAASLLHACAIVASASRVTRV